MSVTREATWIEARAIARGLVGPLGPEEVPVADVDRRVLAVPLVALVDLPGFDASAMDGWAVCGEGPWTVVGEVLAGAPVPAALAEGQAVVVATGAPVPPGTGGVVRAERGEVTGGLLTGTVEPRDVRRVGEEVRAGEVLAVAGTVIGPALIGLLSAAGHERVPVVRRPVARLLILGDEVEVAGLPASGRVRDALGPQVPAWLARAGAVVDRVVHVPDRPGAVAAALTDARGVDLVVTTGGTAHGPRDLLKGAIAEAGGSLVIDEVQVRPGHPMLLAGLAGTPLVGLPGNPHAAVAGLLTLAFPLIDAMLGRPEAPLSRVVLAEPVESRDERTRLVAGDVDAHGFRRAPHQGAAMLRGLASSPGYAVVPPGGRPAGAWVDWLPLP